MHRPAHHIEQVIRESSKIRLLTQGGGEGFKGFSGVVLAAVEAAVYKPLDAPPQGTEERRYGEGRGHYSYLRLSSRQPAEGILKNDDPS